MSRPAATRPDRQDRYRARDEVAVARFNATGTWNLNTWTGATGTIEITDEVTHDGHPVAKIWFPAACTRLYFGVTTGKTFTLPDTWDGNLCAVYYMTDYTAFTQIYLYAGDTAFTLHRSKGFIQQNIFKYNGWRRQGWAEGAATDAPTITGSPTYANTVSARLRFDKPAGAEATVYIALIGRPARTRPQVMFTMDGGYKSQYDIAYPLLKARNIPAAITISADLVQDLYSGHTHMTPVQLMEMYNDASGLFDFGVYADNSSGSVAYGTIGLTAFLANYDSCTAYLQSLGVTDPTFYHSYPNGDYDQTLITALQARGTEMARRADSNGPRHNMSGDSMSPTQLLSMDFTIGTNSLTDLNTAKATFDESLRQGAHIIVLSHQFVLDSATPYTECPEAVITGIYDHALLRQTQGFCDIVSVRDFVGRL